LCEYFYLIYIRLPNFSDYLTMPTSLILLVYLLQFSLKYPLILDFVSGLHQQG